MNKTTFNQTPSHIESGTALFHAGAIHQAGHAGIDYYLHPFSRSDLSLRHEDERACGGCHSESPAPDCYYERDRQMAWDRAAIPIGAFIAHIKAFDPSGVGVLHCRALKTGGGFYPGEPDLLHVGHELGMSQVTLQSQVLGLFHDTRMWTAVQQVASGLTKNERLAGREVGAIFRRLRVPTRGSFLRSNRECPLNVPPREGYAMRSLLEEHQRFQRAVDTWK